MQLRSDCFANETNRGTTIANNTPGPHTALTADAAATIVRPHGEEAHLRRLEPWGHTQWPILRDAAERPLPGDEAVIEEKE
jgi:hypothetical protein